MKIKNLNRSVEYKPHENMSGEIKDNFPPIFISVILPLGIMLILLLIFAIGV